MISEKEQPSNRIITMMRSITTIMLTISMMTIIKITKSSSRAQLAQSAVLGEALGLDIDSKDYTEGMEIDMLLDFVDQIGTATTMSPSMQIEQKGMDFFGPKLKAAMGAFTDG